MEDLNLDVSYDIPKVEPLLHRKYNSNGISCQGTASTNYAGTSLTRR